MNHNPFVLQSLPVLAKLYLWAFNPLGIGLGAKLRRFLGQRLFRVVSRNKLVPTRGRFLYDRQGTPILIEFDATNTQYSALYDAPYQWGYELETSLWIDRLATSGSVFYDIGSNWGYYSLYVASKKEYHGKIYAFEPYQKSCKDLTSMVVQADLGDIIKIMPMGLSDYDGRSAMIMPDGVHSGLARLSPLPAPRDTSIPVAKLDSLDLPLPDLIKIDAEGHEERILQGAQDKISRSHPYILFEHFCRGEEESYEIFDYLKSLHYEVYIPMLIFDLGNRQIRLSYGDDYSVYLKRQTPFELALYRLNPADRALFHHQLNLVAIHPERKPRIEARWV